MPVLARMVPAPLSVEVRSGAIARLGDLLADRRISARGDVAVAVGPGQGATIVEAIRPTLNSAPVHRVDSGSIESAQRLGDVLRAGWYDAVVGIGGGRTLDVAKYAASQAGLPMVSVATSLSHDGIASPVASLEHRGRKGSYGVQTPIAVLVDLDYVRRCPIEQLRAGVGDALSNLSALADWELAGRERGETFDGLAAMFARAAAESVVHRDDELTSDTFLTALAEALVLAGVAMAAAGSSRPCSGACHEIAHAVDVLYPGRASHGAQVAVGAMFACFLRDDPKLAQIDACLRRLEVPRVPRDIGLDEEQFAAAVVEAPATRPDRYTILEHLDMGKKEVRGRVDAFVRAFDR
ncbi:iron-containing alcohol dehydrogenase family protein [Candidatus Solirubrobacter pratensis]|uniref:iron-containing alcohol dehydrogenase family protein n=1 Tax=Candidatus Solirubrobacter pratensis TaxID=1298857 RepID=UPI00048737A9|nr:iron-containing alcohol dehydrogenase family protein [Candidatus Solirubrobacter pratensis]